MIPKAELHVHLEGTIRPAIAKILAKRNHLDFPSHIINQQEQSYISKDFMDFLNVYDELAALIRKPIDYFDITYDYLKQSALKGTIYTEMMYSPDHAEKVSHIASHEHLIAIGEAIENAYQDFGIVGRIITTAVRHFGVEACEKVALEAQKHPFYFVTGFGLGGDEIHFPPQLFEKTYHIARHAGLKTTIHAGEWGDAKSMEVAIQTCKVQRIGHGVRSIESQNTLDMLKDLQIHLEVCPSSNVVLGIYPSISAHPLPALLQQGISVSVNSDDPPFMATTIDKEYDLVQKTFQYSDAFMKQITKNAVKAAFLEEEWKQKLLDKIN
ncbi:MAG TPA: adenosine deaminase [Legionellales bacterium]|nr:adenosine deaminase [Legionellales bacterium]